MLSYTSSAVVTAFSCSPQGARLELQHEKALTTAQPTEMLCALPRQADTPPKSVLARASHCLVAITGLLHDKGTYLVQALHSSVDEATFEK